MKAPNYILLLLLPILLSAESALAGDSVVIPLKGHLGQTQAQRTAGEIERLAAHRDDTRAWLGSPGARPCQRQQDQRAYRRCHGFGLGKGIENTEDWRDVCRGWMLDVIGDRTTNGH